MDDNAIHETIARLGAVLTASGRFLATAESCTGGLLASTLTDVPGSSEWFQGAIVSYSNQAKHDLLGVPRDVLAAHGAVSEPVVRRMALGASRALNAGVTVAVSGIAGPSGGSPEKPVGTVWMAFLADDELRTRRFNFSGTRAEIKAQTVRAAVEGILALAGGGRS